MQGECRQPVRHRSIAAQSRSATIDPLLSIAALTRAAEMQRLRSVMAAAMNSWSRTHSGRWGVEEAAAPTAGFKVTADAARRQRISIDAWADGMSAACGDELTDSTLC